MLSRRTVLLSAAAASAAAALSSRSTPGLAQAPAAKPAVEQSRIQGVGAGGYDLVAYLTQNAAVPGSPAIALEHQGVTWRFATEQNRDAFKADPAKYLPQYGGYCAWAVASGYTAPSDPEAFSVVDGKLYLNYSKAVRFLWARDPKGNIEKGNANWPVVLTK
ncbi:MAG: hypothetical protein RL291_1019 [Pseudomonadota bacterium]